MANGNDSGFGARLATWPIVLLRVYTGVFFVQHGFGKVSRGGSFADGLAGFLNGQENTFGFYRGFVESVVLPNKGLFAFLVAWGELALGVALILGLATRYAGILGAILVANFWFAKGQDFLAGQNHDAVWMVILLVLAFIPAGRTMGLDGKLADRFRFLG